MITNSIGKNAGKVWNAINDNGEMTFSKLMKQTSLSEKELLMALGWLSREEKIFQTNSLKKDWTISLIY